MILLAVKVLVLVISYLYIVLPALPIIPLLYASVQHTQLYFSPNRLRISHITLIIIVLLVKPLLKLLGIVPPLQPNGAAKDLSEAFTLPDLSLSMPLTLSGADSALYRKAVGTTEAKVDGRNPVLLIVGVTEPLMLLLLPKPNCPILPLGAVNVRNKLEFLEPDLCRRVAAGALLNAKAESRLIGTGRRVKRGMEFDVVIEVTSDRDASSGRCILFRKVVTTLQFLKPTVKPRFTDQTGDDRAVESSDPDSNAFQVLDGDLNIAKDAPKRWAAVCKDYNPIHTSEWAAKIFGFPGRIAHGNLVVAQVLELLRSSTGTIFHEMIGRTAKPFWLEVRFRRPMVVPIALQVSFCEKQQPDGVRAYFRVGKAGKVYIEGEVGWM